MNHFTLDTLYLPFDYDQSERRVRVYLPDNYESSNKRYPVIYMHDGQNVFYDDESFSEMSWRVVEALYLTGLQNEFIIVGIDNAGERRIDDYVPYKLDFPIEHGPHIIYQGHGKEYADFLVNTVKPVIDETYPTLSHRKYTAVCGSSLGGLMSAYIGVEYNKFFKFSGVFSLASYFCQNDFLNHIKQDKLLKKACVYIQTGTHEGLDENHQGSKVMSQQYINSTLAYQKALLEAGLSVDQIDLNIYAFEIHREKYWALHFPQFLNFLANEMRLNHQK